MGGLIRCLCQALSCKLWPPQQEIFVCSDLPLTMWVSKALELSVFYYNFAYGPVFLRVKSTSITPLIGWKQIFGQESTISNYPKYIHDMNEELNRLTYEDWTLLYKLVDVHQSSIRLNTKRMHPSIAKSASSRDKGSFLGALTIGAIAHDHDQTDAVSPYHIISYHIISYHITHIYIYIIYII